MSNFRGNNAINMDAKGRLAIPAKVREDLADLCGGRIVLTASANRDERCLLIYPEPQWEAIEAQINRLPTMKKSVRRLQRIMLGYATPLELDGAGRVLVPPTLRSFAGLEKRLMLVGQGKKFELWDETRWLELVDDFDDDDDMPPEMEALSL
ncbi:division/cell wall cluster transcriptional repressor MraZ [Marinobacter zhejiangensis]|uniref:Transcriptional regulator MraZ n=1 Tax=Marinobacter zhejiangensis TaxID=488535 RepID=A0A1I4TB29_9GAMM|nr:division/cell wall cluster transcriptional repressor MraZ [Marinobacter zhejiangensis]SFM73770.1 MraZ protein [Marinobacter zhejiangensis]